MSVLSGLQKANPTAEGSGRPSNWWNLQGSRGSEMEQKVEHVVYLLLAAAVVLSLISSGLVLSKVMGSREAAKLAEEAAKPANIDVITITTSFCKDCFDISTTVDALKKENVKINSDKTIDALSSEAKQLIADYKINKLPTIIVTGEVGRQSVKSFFGAGWQTNDKSAVYTGQLPPYTDAAGTVKGIVEVTQIVDRSCEKCGDMSTVIDFFKQSGVKFSSEKIFDYESNDGKELIKKFGVDRLPAMIISKDILEYPDVKAVWPQLGAEEKEGMFALHTTSPPYRDIAAGNIVGLTDVVYLSDKSCAACYNVTVNRRILENFGMALDSESNLDVSDAAGKVLIQKYAITKVPVILVSPEGKEYARFVSAWQQVGDVADDSWYIMRNPNVLGTYKDLTTGQVVAPQPAQAANSGDGQ
jgi:thiol-disulfide isomerase/thioredoxin